MYYIYDIEGQVGDFGNASIVTFFEDVANEHSLSILRRFMKNGFTVEVRGLVEELESVDYGHGDYADVAAEVIEVLKGCREIAILNNGFEEE